MDMLPTAMILARSAMNREVFSALPDAPVVVHQEPSPRPPRAVRPRAALAAILERAARAVEPATCSPAR